MNKLLLFLTIVATAGCAPSQQFDAVPPGINKEQVRREVYRITAESFSFTPEVIRVKSGTLVRLEITSIRGTHGFQLGAFGIDERLEENEMKPVEFYASKQGEYRFRCSHFCGLGHTGMTGKIIVE